MTTYNAIQTAGRFRLPDPPEREPDEVTAFDHLHRRGKAEDLAQHFGKPETTLIAAERWIVASPEYNRARTRRPDLLIAFNVSPEDYRASNGYVVSEQGKPPDFVLEVASESTADIDTGAKRDDYAALGIPEYWRFDETGDHHGARLAGDILQGDSYRPIPLEETAPGIVQGYSPALRLIIRWDHGQLVWLDPDREEPILTYEDQRDRARAAEARADTERDARIQSEARVREMEEEVRRMRREEPS